jgi:KipI family sensor histidine kinase inhibitor
MSRRLLDYGPSALLLECEDLPEALGLLPLLRSEPNIDEAIPGARTVLLRLNGQVNNAQRRRLLTVPAMAPDDTEFTPIRLEVDYSGEDLAEVAKQIRSTPDEVVRLHTSQIWTVGFCGFSPGFAYLQPEHDRLRVRRRPVPRTRVPAGAVGLADSWSGIYPREGPGGWQLIGRTKARIWDVHRASPALLQPGGRVQFLAVNES